MQELAGQIAFLQRTCDLLSQQLKDMEHVVTDEEIPPLLSVDIAQHGTRWGSAAKADVEMAARHLEEWRRHVEATVAQARAIYATDKANSTADQGRLL